MNSCQQREGKNLTYKVIGRLMKLLTTIFITLLLSCNMAIYADMMHGDYYSSPAFQHSKDGVSFRW